MSDENVELARVAYECMNQRDVEGLLCLCAPSFEFHDLPRLPGSGVHRGHEAIRAWWAQLLEVFDDLHFEPVALINAGGDRIVAPTHGFRRGIGSGAAVEMHFTNVWTLRDGMIDGYITYDSHAEVLDAVGLTE